jgi:hypothetical protein
MKAIIELDVPEFQIGQEVSIYFKDTMMIKGIVQAPCGDAISRQAVLDAIEELKKIHFDRVVVLNKVRDRVLDLPSVNPQKNIVNNGTMNITL